LSNLRISSGKRSSKHKRAESIKHKSLKPGLTNINNMALLKLRTASGDKSNKYYFRHATKIPGGGLTVVFALLVKKRNLGQQPFSKCEVLPLTGRYAEKLRAHHGAEFV
jgi:hypothetical protein